MKFSKIDKIFIICMAVGFVLVTIFLPNPLNTPNVYVDPKAIIGIVLIPIVLGLIFLYDKFIRKKRGDNGKSGIRRGWTEIEKEEVRIRQNGVCNKCGRPPPRWEYHHRDGNRSNNSLSNCEGLCPNCHSVKTHD